MAGIINYVDIDQQKNTILNFKQHPISQSQINDLTSSLGINDKGLAIYNITEKKPYWWDGIQFSTISGSDSSKISFLDRSHL